MDTHTHMISYLEQLKKNSRMNKHQHFHAAERDGKKNSILGLIVIVINVSLGTVLATATESFGESIKWVGAILAMTAAVCSAIQTTFNFQKSLEGHRRIANRYLEIQRECELLLAHFQDGLVENSVLSSQIDSINSRYTHINNDAESFPTGDGDHEKAVQHEKRLEAPH